MPALIAFIDETALGYAVTCYENGNLVEEVLMLDPEAAEFYAEDFMEKKGIGFPPLFDWMQ